MTTARESFWSQYYEQVAKKGDAWLDYSNERVQAQTFGLVIEALGPLAGRDCLDVGCGYGQLARALHAFGAKRVTGIDLSSELISQLKSAWPNMDYRRGTLGDTEFRQGLGTFDTVTLVEVLQYLPLAETLAQAFELLRPGGRIVIVVPNGECPIVGRAIERFTGNYLAPGPHELLETAGRLTDPKSLGIQGMWFAENQTIFPYVTSNWATELPRLAVHGAMHEGTDAPPNRLLLTFQKQC
jgi:2-polyprenyl-3-methyl-5-hydroxy-6-metoxy-1,4-benzoquinol methylase